MKTFFLFGVNEDERTFLLNDMICCPFWDSNGKFLDIRIEKQENIVYTNTFKTPILVSIQKTKNGYRFYDKDSILIFNVGCIHQYAEYYDVIFKYQENKIPTFDEYINVQ